MLFPPSPSLDLSVISQEHGHRDTGAAEFKPGNRKPVTAACSEAWETEAEAAEAGEAAQAAEEERN